MDRMQEKCDGEVAINSLNFCYPTRPDTVVLRSFTVSAKRGQSIAIVGPSGSGKSTVVQLIERFYEVFSGVIVSVDLFACTQLDSDRFKRPILYPPARLPSVDRRLRNLPERACITYIYIYIYIYNLFIADDRWEGHSRAEHQVAEIADGDRHPGTDPVRRQHRRQHRLR